FFLGVSLVKKWRASAGWFSLLVIGQAISLQLIEAGNQIGYQHYRIENTYQLVLIGLFIVQTVMAIWGLSKYWQSIWNWIRINLNVWQIILIGFIFILSSTALSRNIPEYLAELIFAAFIQVVNLVTVVLAVHAIPPEVLQNIKGKFEKWFPLWSKDKHKKIDRFAILCALWVFGFALILNIFSYERHPHIPDEVVYLYQAEYFSEGHLTLNLPPFPEAFNVNLMYYDEDNQRWFSPVPPGWPAFLALGSLIDLPFLLNPLLAGINILLSYLLIREISDNSIARISIMLLSVSPWYIFMAMNYMTHTFTLTSALVAALAAIRMKTFCSAKWALISGAAIGAVSLIRPLEGLAVAIVLGSFALSIKPWRKKIILVAFMVISTP
ncbi:MAG: hypothetical protein GWN01_01050, partial [Nitrosopumilaceae archaeon]|nr:glycosyltransferase family 39 protein [Nitrosopumilaceae archaeon]NIX60167.1 hypothetical protein [Nitrosopumilaceae archaeon]